MMSFNYEKGLINSFVLSGSEDDFALVSNALFKAVLLFLSEDISSFSIYEHFASISANENVIHNVSELGRVADLLSGDLSGAHRRFLDIQNPVFCSFVSFFFCQSPHVLCVDTTCLLYTSPSPRDQA
eukprot:TRINITY_DN4225_c0_g1_i2.p1 TRINITY_DN4225_c0_g1~~TRINITY_DN4225_c0_g1_i2.p1  ORF type:complete len:127 (+),score=12.26 TRINITY_DN4225_c0_g1_i2:131-511(+)